MLTRSPLFGVLRTVLSTAKQRNFPGTRAIASSSPSASTEVTSAPKSSSADQDVLEPEAYEVAERRRWVVQNIAQRIEDRGRQLFAVIYIQKKQFKVIQDDIIHIEHNIPLDVGEEIKLEKVLMVGGADFTLIGRPLLDPKHVHVMATVVEKTTTSPEVQYNFKVQRIENPQWLSQELTVLRINNIYLEKGLLGEP